MIWLLIGYMFLFIHRPFEVWPALADLHIERVYMAVTLLVALVWPGKRLVANGLHWAFAAFAAAVCICWVASPWTAEGQEAVENFFKILVFYGLVVCFVRNERDLRLLVGGFLAVMALYMAHSLREFLGGRYVYRMDIVRMVGVDDYSGDPNSFGATVLYALPFALAFWRTTPSPRIRWMLVGYALLSLVCIALTGSRSAFVGLIFLAAITILRSSWRSSLLIVAVLTAPLLWSALPQSLQERFETILYPEVGPENAQVSAEGRIQGLVRGIELWQENPVTGCGPGAWRPATHLTIESHNLYGQLLGEMGTLGAVCFFLVLIQFWRNIGWIRRVYKAHPYWENDFLAQMAGAVGLGVLLLLLEGNFSHNLFRFNWVWFGAFLAVTRAVVSNRLRVEALSNMTWDPAMPATSSITAAQASMGAS